MAPGIHELLKSLRRLGNGIRQGDPTEIETLRLRLLAQEAGEIGPPLDDLRIVLRLVHGRIRQKSRSA